MVWCACCLISCVPSLLMANLCPGSLLHGFKHLGTRVHMAVLPPALCWDWEHCLEQSNSGCLSRNCTGVAWHCLKLWCGRRGRKLHADLGSGFAAAQPPLWVNVHAAGWRPSHVIQGFVRYSIIWKGLENITPRHTKCIFFRLVLHNTSIFSKVVTAIITQQRYNCRFSFSEALPLPWMMLILNMSAHLPGGSQQLKLLDGLNYL